MVAPALSRPLIHVSHARLALLSGPRLDTGCEGSRGAGCAESNALQHACPCARTSTHAHIPVRQLAPTHFSHPRVTPQSESTREESKHTPKLMNAAPLTVHMFACLWGRVQWAVWVTKVHLAGKVFPAPSAPLDPPACRSPPSFNSLVHTHLYSSFLHVVKAARPGGVRKVRYAPPPRRL